MSLDSELARFDHEVVLLETVLDSAIKLAARTLTALRNEEAQAVADTSASRRKVDIDYTKRVREAVAAVEAATRAKVSLEKTAALRAKQMSQEQRLSAFEAAISHLPYADRRKFLMACVSAHNFARAAEIAAGLAKPGDTKTFVDVA
jgi:hypothetical protein